MKENKCWHLINQRWLPYTSDVKKEIIWDLSSYIWIQYIIWWKYMLFGSSGDPLENVHVTGIWPRRPRSVAAL